jgi:hypothetical protein
MGNSNLSQGPTGPRFLGHRLFRLTSRAEVWLHPSLRRFTIFLSAALAGCAQAELNSNTLDLAHSIESLYRNQALTNLSRLIDDPNTVPSQVDITSGQVQTQDQATGQGTFPLGNQVTSSVTSGTAMVTGILENFRQLVFGLNISRWS